MDNIIGILKSLKKTPQLLRVDLRTNLFLLKYFGKFKIKKINNDYILHSHLPPINSSAYTKFVDQHLIKNISGPSHAQIGLTNACPQKCSYCYNKIRFGKAMDNDTIINCINELGKMGVTWLGLTGGEPLLNKNIVEIIDRTDKDITIKLFTTGCTLTQQKALDMKKAGLTYVSVSLDSSREEDHDHARGYKNAFKEALRGIEIFLNAGLHTGVSTVLTKEMMNQERMLEFLGFLENLGVHEAWLSEVKPSSEYFWHKEFVISRDETDFLIKLQDQYNKKDGMTINYLGHFEHGSHFGCNAGIKMLYIDAFGEVSPCVFAPITFGNVRDIPLPKIFEAMTTHFKPDRECFINKNYPIIKKHYRNISPIPTEDALAILEEIRYTGIPDFNRIQGGKS
jgi:MoaA/NifB/PqqE/SkfB family radical SAM enzyme